MVDCGESVPSTHRCGECGDDCFGTLDLEKLAEEFDGAEAWWTVIDILTEEVQKDV